MTFLKQFHYVSLRSHERDHLCVIGIHQHVHKDMKETHFTKYLIKLA